MLNSKKSYVLNSFVVFSILLYGGHHIVQNKESRTTAPAVYKNSDSAIIHQDTLPQQNNMPKNHFLNEGIVEDYTLVKRIRQKGKQPETPYKLCVKNHKNFTPTITRRTYYNSQKRTTALANGNKCPISVTHQSSIRIACIDRNAYRVKVRG